MLLVNLLDEALELHAARQFVVIAHVHHHFCEDALLLNEDRLLLVKVDHLADLLLQVLHSLGHQMIVAKLHAQHRELSFADPRMAIASLNGGVDDCLLELVTERRDHHFGELGEEEHVVH